MIDPVESVAANPALKPLIRTRIDRRGWWYLAVKRGIEDGHLRNRAEEFFDYLHTFHFGANVQWRESREALNGRSHFVGDQHGVPKMRAAMDHTVPYDIDLRSGSDCTRLPLTQRAQQMPNHLLARGDGQLFFQDDSLRVFHHYRCGIGTPLDPPLPQGGGRMRRKCCSNFVQAGLLAAGT